VKSAAWPYFLFTFMGYLVQHSTWPVVGRESYMPPQQ
jgi:hypothetical protein